MKLIKKNYRGEINRYGDWRANVVRLADKINLSDEIRDKVTEPIMKDAWNKNLYPGFFIGQMIRLFS